MLLISIALRQTDVYKRQKYESTTKAVVANREAHRYALEKYMAGKSAEMCIRDRYILFENSIYVLYSHIDCKAINAMAATVTTINFFILFIL